jgi:hypothetical protein
MTTRTQTAIDSHPAASSENLAALAKCIDACQRCLQACCNCADACLHEEHLQHLRFCIRTDLDCAEICAAVVKVLSRASRPHLETVRALLETCRIACHSCSLECLEHAQMHEHCRICAAACQNCEAACAALLRQTPAGQDLSGIV